MMAGAAIPLVGLGAEGVTAPALAYGTGTAWFNKNEELSQNEALVASVAAAIRVGFRHIDCAEMYKNEQHVGQGIRRAGVPRNELFITSKVYQALEDPAAGLRASLARLGLTYLDLYLVHSPFKFPSPEAMQSAWASLESCVEQGLTRAIGVSNFRAQDLTQLLATARVPPAVNQIEFHPYLQSPELVTLCKENGIKIEAYGALAPLLGAAGGPLDPLLEEIAARHGRTKAQVLIRWVLQRECMVVTTTSKEDRMQEYLGVGGFTLSPQEVEAINSAGREKEYRRFWVQEFVRTRL